MHAHAVARLTHAVRSHTPPNARRALAHAAHTVCTRHLACIPLAGDGLETYTEHNVMWHTGRPRNMRSDTNVKESRFWEFLERVAAGTSVPPGRNGAKRWDEQVRETVVDHMFYQ